MVKLTTSRLLAFSLLVPTLFLPWSATSAQKVEPKSHPQEYRETVQPFLKRYCLDCHSTKAKKGSLDLERFASLDVVRKDLKPWQHAIEQLETGEMPPKEKPQPTAEERMQLVQWIRRFLDDEARARAGDPGFVPLRRLSNAEFDTTIRELTGVDLRPTREFPADGAAGEGFTNAAEALTDISPALLTKYLNAAKELADHAVLLPDGFRFSLGTTRRDWTDESTAKLRKFYAEVAGDGRLPLQPYILTIVRHREALTSGKMTPHEAATKEKLNAKYLETLYRTLTDKTPSYPLDIIRDRLRTATEKDVPAIVGEITAWQTSLWKFVPIGSYRYGNVARQVPNEAAAVESQLLRYNVKPTPGQNEVVLYLVAHDLSGTDKKGHVVWQRPRFEAQGKPALLLRDYDKFGSAFEVDYSLVFAESGKYLAAVAEAAHDAKTNVDDLAKKHNLDPAFLKRWIEVTAVVPVKKESEPKKLDKQVPTVDTVLLDEKSPPNAAKPAINSWRKRGTDLPAVFSNSSDKVDQIPGRIGAHQVAVHPLPQEFVAVVWKSPIAGTVRFQTRITHSHPTCGNGVAWWFHHRRGDRSIQLGEGAVGLGGEAKPPVANLTVEKGDWLILAVDANAGSHICDLTEIAFTITEADKPSRVWDLTADIADNLHQGNPHADKHGHKEVWSFVRGASRGTNLTPSAGPTIPLNSLLSRWREVAADPAKRADWPKLAEAVQQLLAGPRPMKENDPDRVLYDRLVAPEGILLKGLPLHRYTKPRPKDMAFGLDRARFGKHPDNRTITDTDLVTPIGSVLEIRLPANLLRERDFVVDGKLDAGSDGRMVRFQLLNTPPTPERKWDGKSPLVVSPNGSAHKQLLKGYDDFRRVFPQFLCFSQVIPTDEVVSLKMFHREDEPLIRLFLNEEQQRRIDHLWTEHRFVSKQAVMENDYLPQFIGYVTQDQPKELLNYFESQRPVFRKRADEYAKDAETAIPKQLQNLYEFAARAYRRPLTESQKTELENLYQTLRKKGVTHEEAFRGVLTRIFVSPAFLFRIEQAKAGKTSTPVDDWELATRLSYFLWSSGPDEELRRLAAEGKLRDPKTIEAQVRRMVADNRIRSLAIEFGTQWIHVRGFDAFNEKNEKLFPTFDANLRKAIYEESILFFQDMFQNDRAVTKTLDADYTFLNEQLAKHYGIPGVTGPQWRRVDGVQKYGRGGILGMASVQTKQAGASRTSPVLRGNWVVETLLGEKLPRPPANVPRLPEEEGKDQLTMRQQVEKHARVAECAVCHQRIDPFGFALEQFDPIGRRREKDLGGLAVDTKVKLKDGTEFEGIAGLRGYLLTKKKEVIVRLFCKKLLGYALGRSVTLSDQSLLDEMVAELQKNDGKISSAVLTIIRSPQFRMIRGSDFEE